MHPHQDNNGRAGNVDDPNYHAANATVLFLPASSVDRFSRRNRLMRAQFIDYDPFGACHLSAKKLDEVRSIKDISRRVRNISRENGPAQISGFCLL